MKIEKLPSGSYRIRKMYKGKNYSIVTDYKPTQKEAIQLMADELDRVKTRTGRMTFEEAAENYIESKKNVLSPSTVREYTFNIKRLSEQFTSMPVSKIDQDDIQKEINRIAKNKSPKTVRNYHGFISSVLKYVRPEMNICTTLPKNSKKEPHIPSDDDVRELIKLSEGTRYEIALSLACYGLRRSEICALTPEDIEGDIVHITKAKVLSDGGEWVIKSTKTTESTRDIVIPKNLARKIKKTGYIYNGDPVKISKYMAAVQKKNNIAPFSLHKLRHYFASKMSEMHIADEDIMKMGGWKTDHVMKTVYRHSMHDKEEESKREAANKLGDVIF